MVTSVEGRRAGGGHHIYKIPPKQTIATSKKISLKTNILSLHLYYDCPSMKKLLLILFFLLPIGLGFTIHAQSLSVNTTRFVGGDSSCGAMGNSFAISTRDGGVLFFGSTECYIGGGDIPSNFPDTIGSEGGNVLIGKLDSNLNVNWVKVYGGTQIDMAVSAVQTSDGGYAILAYTQSNDHYVSGNHGSGDLWLVRLDSLGNLVWQKCYGSTYDEQPGSIALTPDNGLIMFGISNGFGDDVPAHYGTQFNYNWFLVKTDSAGNKQWAKTIGGTARGIDGGEESNGSIFYANNGYYFVSATNSTDHDCTDTFWHPNVNTGYDYYIFKLDTAGNILWDSSYGGSGGDAAFQAIWDNRDSSIVINGLTTSTDYMVTGYNGGSADMWVVKTDKNGVLKWEKCIGGLKDDEGHGITLAPFGYVIYGSTYPGNIGGEDAWIFVLDSIGDTLSNLQFGGISYESPNSIFSFQNGFAGVGTSNSMNFTEGYNIGHLPGLIGETFVSYLNFWSVGVTNVSIDEPQITIYPNPSTENIRIITPNRNGNIIVFNCIGEKIFSISNVCTSIAINVAGWSTGLYIIQWQGEDGTAVTKKLIIN